MVQLEIRFTAVLSFKVLKCVWKNVEKVEKWNIQKETKGKTTTYFKRNANATDSEKRFLIDDGPRKCDNDDAIHSNLPSRMIIVAIPDNKRFYVAETHDNNFDIFDRRIILVTLGPRNFDEISTANQWKTGNE